MLRNENGMLAGYVFVDLSSNDIGGYVEKAKEIVGKGLQLPYGVFPDLERPVRKHAARFASG